MDCQSGCPLRSAGFAYFPRSRPGLHALPWAVPQSGQRLERQRSQTLWRYRDIPFGLDWHIACKLQKVHVRTQSPSVK